MKKLKRLVISPPQEQTYYECEHCDFTTLEEWRANEHHAQAHCVKAIQTLGEYNKLYYFDNEWDARAYAHYEHSEAEWSQPGWYGFTDEEHKKLVSIYYFIDLFSAEIRDTQKFIDKLMEIAQVRVA